MKAWKKIKAMWARAVHEKFGGKVSPEQCRPMVSLFKGAGPRSYRRNLDPNKVKIAVARTQSYEVMVKYTPCWRSLT